MSAKVKTNHQISKLKSPEKNINVCIPNGHSNERFLICADVLLGLRVFLIRPSCFNKEYSEHYAAVFLSCFIHIMTKVTETSDSGLPKGRDHFVFLTLHGKQALYTSNSSEGHFKVSRQV